MATYDKYIYRSRVGVGVKIKLHQASVIFRRSIGRVASCVHHGILEIGPGDGYIAELSKAAGFPYTAVEGSEGVATGMRARGFRVLEGYVPPLPSQLQDEFSVCFLLHVLEHMKSPIEASQLVGAVYNKLIPGGVFVVACPDASRWGFHFFDCDYTHAYPLSRRRLVQLLRDQGFEVVENTIYTGPLFGFLGLPISWFAKILYWPLLDDLIGPKRFGDMYSRGFLTFLPNLLVIARRPEA